MNKLNIIGRGCSDEATKRQELDAQGKHMMDQQWDKITRVYNDPTIRYEKITVNYSDGHGVSAEEIANVNPNDAPVLLVTEIKKLWAHARSAKLPLCV